ncbi:MAG: hypothetical protein WC770_03045 [Phycisphaerae bacterium]|jgi:hypothetical protein
MDACIIGTGRPVFIELLLIFFIACVWLTIILVPLICLIIMTKRLGRIADSQQQIADAVKVIADKNTMIK